MDSPAIPLHAGMLPGHAQLNARLEPFFLAMAEDVPDAVSNSPGGPYFSDKWLSRPDLHERDAPELKALSAAIRDYVAANLMRPPGDTPPPIATMWCIVSRRGMTGRPHCHRGQLSGAYYVNAGVDDGAGGGAFIVHPPPGSADARPRAIRPRTGMLLAFPSPLMHAVAPYRSDAPRIVVSFNMA